MLVHSSLKASDSYDTLYYLAEFVVVSRHLALTRRDSALSPHTSLAHSHPGIQSYPEGSSTTVRGILKICGIIALVFYEGW